ncbi:unnamed protein product [Clonostachys chloroleuca]|uniref:Uncharacterized protein n=1 Tax=Clonostachys chloroleuca TaxID=1926264 RepID=A0AA35Q4Q2_9HYPO|nr:unnamed protein product [Clonostachys chloroleuca]
MSPPGDYTTQSFRGESHLEATIEVSNEKREDSKDAFRAGAPGSMIEIHEDKENLAVCKESAKRGFSDGHSTSDFYPGSGGRFKDFQKDLKGTIRPDTVAQDGGNDTEVQESEREVEIQDSEDEWN